MGGRGSADRMADYQKYIMRYEVLLAHIPPGFDLVWPECVCLAVDTSVWEKPIMSGKYTVGFVDLQVDYETGPGVRIQELDAPYAYPPGGFCRDFKQEFERTGKMGMPHLEFMFRHHGKINFEVKSTLPSLGEVIRQIRLYQQYQDYGNHTYVIVSPDSRWETTLASQGIGFVLYPGRAEQGRFEDGESGVTR